MRAKTSLNKSSRLCYEAMNHCIRLFFIAMKCGAERLAEKRIIFISMWFTCNAKLLSIWVRCISSAIVIRFHLHTCDTVLIICDNFNRNVDVFGCFRLPTFKFRAYRSDIFTRNVCKYPAKWAFYLLFLLFQFVNIQMNKGGGTYPRRNGITSLSKDFLRVAKLVLRWYNLTFGVGKIRISHLLRFGMSW